MAIERNVGRPLTDLEWSVVRLAKRDALSSISDGGRLARAFGLVFGGVHSNRLADPRLEALRRLSVCAWHRGGLVDPAQSSELIAAGFDGLQLNAVLSSISQATGHSRRGGEL